MINKFLPIVVLSLLSMSACNDKTKQKNSTPQPTELAIDKIMKSSVSDKEGNQLKLTFNNTKNTAVLIFKDDTIGLSGQRTASGIWYKNDHYELRGKGKQLQLSKDGVVIFKN